MEARFEVPAEEELVVGPSPVHTKVVRAKLLVGVDGMRSQVRKIMVGDEPRDLLLITWNAVVPKESVRYTPSAGVLLPVKMVNVAALNLALSLLLLLLFLR